MNEWVVGLLSTIDPRIHSPAIRPSLRSGAVRISPARRPTRTL